MKLKTLHLLALLTAALTLSSCHLFHNANDWPIRGGVYTKHFTPEEVKHHRLPQ